MRTRWCVGGDVPAVRALAASCPDPSACVLQIKRMEMEARSLPPDKSKQLLLKVKDYKADLSMTLKEQLKKASASASGGDAARAELVS